ELIEVAASCGRSMAAAFGGGGAVYQPILRVPEKDPLPYGDQWSRSPGCYQLKSALAWHDLHRATGESEFLALYERALEQCLRTESSFLPGAQGEGIMDRLHAYCYFLEALLPRADWPEAAAVLAAGIERVAEHLHRIAPLFARSDVYAQLLR